MGFLVSSYEPERRSREMTASYAEDAKGGGSTAKNTESAEGDCDLGFTIYEADLIGVGAFTEGELNRNPDKVPG